MTDPKLVERIARVLDSHVARILMVQTRGMCRHGCSAACAADPCEAWPPKDEVIAGARMESAARILALMEPGERVEGVFHANSGRFYAQEVRDPWGPHEQPATLILHPTGDEETSRDEWEEKRQAWNEGHAVGFRDHALQVKDEITRLREKQAALVEALRGEDEPIETLEHVADYYGIPVLKRLAALLTDVAHPTGDEE